jgi:predicted nucleic acid-binding protein
VASVILVDANLLLYAYYPRADQHERSKVWLESVLSPERAPCASPG